MSEAKRGGQPGNDNAVRAKRWREAITRALARKAGSVDQGLDNIAEKLVLLAMDGDPWAIDHMADRLDGKPRQELEHGAADGQPFAIMLFTGDEARRLQQKQKDADSA